MGVNKKLSSASFIISMLLILTVGFTFLGGLYYFINQDKPTLKNYLSSKEPITSAPTTFNLELTSPQDDFLTFNKQIEITGHTNPDLNILISSASFDKVIQASSDGSFSTDFDLSLGVNEISVVVFDKNGDQRSASKTVYYSKEKI